MRAGVDCLRKVISSKSDVVVLIAQDLSVLGVIERGGKAGSNASGKTDDEFHVDFLGFSFSRSCVYLAESFELY